MRSGSRYSRRSSYHADSDDAMSPLSPDSPSVIPYQSVGIARDPAGGVSRGDILANNNTVVLGGVDLADVERWAEDVEKNPLAQLSQTVLSRMSMGDVLMKRGTLTYDRNMVFNTTIDMQGSLIANQLLSGRCWLFATTNVLRIFVSRKYGLEDFQLSQSYLFFYDHVSKANWFLEQMISLAEEPLDSRTNQFILHGTEAQDGGQYDMAVNLIETFGVVPHCIYPESFNSSHSDEVDELLSAKLREHALELREIYHQELDNHGTRERAISKCRKQKKKQMAEVYRILAITCGTPPHPDEKFVWEFYDKDKKYQKIISTPREFARVHTGYNASAGVPLIHDPRNPPNRLYSVQRLGNVVGGRPIRYINAEITVLKQAAIEALKRNDPVWFGSDVEMAKSFAEGILDTALYNYDDAFGTTLGMNKAERLNTGESSMTHASKCNKGFFLMSDRWFEENVFQVVVQRAYVPGALLSLYDNPNANVTNLPPWDPLGALACNRQCGGDGTQTSASAAADASSSSTSN
ncbi:bleomycin hydrolase [Pseudohyphozyma bogoriensis]|nr:bleomycin hydrolase [Pseudohyphozyma bogoriensis]